jgi:hypothetical protein
VNWLNDVDVMRRKTKELNKNTLKAVSKKSPFDPKPFVGKLSTRLRVEIETKWADYPKHNCKTFQSIDERYFSSEWEKHL